MKRKYLLWGLAAAAAVFIYEAICLGQKPPDGVRLDAISVEKLRILDVMPDCIRLEAVLNLKPSRSLTVASASFSRMRVNGIPFYVSPLNSQFRLQSGSDNQLPPVPITLFYRDVDSLAPLRELIEKDHVHLTGRLLLGPKLNLIQKLALRGHPQIAVLLDREAPIQIAGGPLAKKAMLAVLDLAQRALDAAGSALHRLQTGQTAWREDLQTRSSQALLRLRASYTIQVNNRKYDLYTETLGFRISPTVAVAPAEIMEPWRYDPEIAAAMDSGSARLTEESFNLDAWAALSGPPDPPKWSQSNQDFSIVFQPNPRTRKTIVVGAHKTIFLPQSASGTSFVLLQFAAGEEGPSLTPATKQLSDDPSGERVALFRLDERNSNPEVIFVTAHRDGAAIKLDRPLDPSFFGSPILTPEGVVGMVEEEESGISMANILKILEAQPEGHAQPVEKAEPEPQR
jgi:hypothetical protein